MKVTNNISFRNYNYFKVNFSANPQKVANQTVQKLSVEDAIEAILGLFNKNPNDLLPHHRPLVASSSNKILGISMKTKKGNDLSVTKIMGSNLRQGLRYLSFVEKNSKGKRLNTISIDLENNEFLKLGLDNKPVVKDDNVHYYSASDLKAKKISKKFAQYVELIFTNPEANITKGEAIFVNKKNVNKVAEINIDDAIDSDLFKKLDNEYKDEFTIIKPEEAQNIDFIV